MTGEVIVNPSDNLREKYNNLSVELEEKKAEWALLKDDPTITNDGVQVELAGNIGSPTDRKSTRLNSSHVAISYAVFCLKKNKLTELQSGLIGDAVAAVLISGLGYAVTTANDTDDQISTEEVQ